MDEVSIHDDNAIGDMVRLNKEIRESIKDLMAFNNGHSLRKDCDQYHQYPQS